MFSSQFEDTPPGPNNWPKCAADISELNAAFGIADAEANSCESYHRAFEVLQAGYPKPRAAFVATLTTLVRAIERREGFTLGMFPRESVAYALACCWIDSQQPVPSGFSEWLDLHRGKAGARRYVMTYDPRDGTKVARNSIYGRSDKEARELASRIGGVFGFKNINVNEAR